MCNGRKKSSGFTVIEHLCHAKHSWALEFHVALMTVTGSEEESLILFMKIIKL